MMHLDRGVVSWTWSWSLSEVILVSRAEVQVTVDRSEVVASQRIQLK